MVIHAQAAALMYATHAVMPSLPAQFDFDPALRTVAEASGYTATSTSAQVLELISAILAQSEVMRVGELGRTSQGKPIPLVLLANPPVATIDEARRTGKPIGFVLANIHAGEIEGKEASLMLMRELALNAGHPLLRELVVIVAPNYNADGNDVFDTVEVNRPGQVGPEQCGIRANAQGLDLNRDYIKLEAPESRALVTFLDQCDPHITIDCHTTNGSHHRYVLTYEAPLNPSGHHAPVEFVRDRLLPEVTRRIKQSTGYDMWHYGNFNAEHTRWDTYSAQPRFGGQYQGLRSQMSVLSEAYSYAPYRDRVLATRAFICEILTYAAEHSAEVLEIHDRARRETAKRGTTLQPADTVGIQHRLAAFNEPVRVKGFAHTPKRPQEGVGGAAIVSHDNLGPPHEYLCVHNGRFEPTLSVVRPAGYIIPDFPGATRIVENLRRHGIDVQPFEGAADCQVYTITTVNRAEREFQGHCTVSLNVTSAEARRTFSRGTWLVHTSQPLGTLAVYLLEPQSDDGLATWNFLDDHIAPGREFPILRLRSR